MIEAVKAPADVVGEWERGTGTRQPLVIQEPKRACMFFSEEEARFFVEEVCFPLLGEQYQNWDTFGVAPDTTKDSWHWVTVKGASAGVIQRISDRRLGWSSGRLYECMTIKQ